MSVEVTVAMKQQYHDNIVLLAQQKDSRLSGCVRNEQQSAEFDFWDQIGATQAQKKQGRHTDAPLISTPHDRRRVALEDYEWADLIDKQDKLRTIGELTNPYAINASAAMRRAKDDEIINAFFGTAYTGKDGSTSVTFPSSQQVAVDYVFTGAAADSGLTIPKLIEAVRIIRANDVDLDEEELFICITSRQLQDLLNTTQTTSADYNNVKALVEGKIDRFMGLTFKHSERLLTDSNGHVRVPVWCKSGMLMATGMDVTTRIDERADKSYSTQVYVSMSVGATRMEEKKVVEVLCDIP